MLEIRARDSVDIIIQTLNKLISPYSLILHNNVLKIVSAFAHSEEIFSLDCFKESKNIIRTKRKIITYLIIISIKTICEKK